MNSNNFIESLISIYAWSTGHWSDAERGSEEEPQRSAGNATWRRDSAGANYLWLHSATRGAISHCILLYYLTVMWPNILALVEFNFTQFNFFFILLPLGFAIRLCGSVQDSSRARRLPLEERESVSHVVKEVCWNEIWPTLASVCCISVRIIWVGLAHCSIALILNLLIHCHCFITNSRYYLISGNCVYYYSHKRDVRPKGVIFLTGSIVERVSATVMRLQMYNASIFCLCCTTHCSALLYCADSLILHYSDHQICSTYIVITICIQPVSLSRSRTRRLRWRGISGSNFCTKICARGSITGTAGTSLSPPSTHPSCILHSQLPAVNSCGFCRFQRQISLNSSSTMCTLNRRHEKRVLYCRSESQRDKWVSSLQHAAHVVPIEVALLLWFHF